MWKLESYAFPGVPLKKATKDCRDITKADELDFWKKTSRWKMFFAMSLRLGGTEVESWQVVFAPITAAEMHFVTHRILRLEKIPVSWVVAVRDH